MKAVRLISLLAVCGLVTAGSALAEATPPAPQGQEIAAKPELVVAAIRGRNAEDSAAILTQALAAVFSSDWPEAKKREHCIALIAYAVAAKGKEAAPMMGIVAAWIPPSWLPVVAATAVVAAGDNSPAVAKAMLEAVAGNAQAAEACRTACANPSSVLSPAEIKTIRGYALQAAATTLPLLAIPAEKYMGQ